MKTSPLAKSLIYLLIILLSLAFLVLTALSPREFLDVNSVYQGF